MVNLNVLTNAPKIINFIFHYATTKFYYYYIFIK
jgi:hypothetical protein